MATPEPCGICGVRPDEEGEFLLDGLPLCPAKRYCPACHERFRRRALNALRLAMAPLLLWGVLSVLRSGRPPLDSPLVWVPLLMVVQSLWIVPHELGHALAARLLGYTRIRVVIGRGRPLGGFESFGIRWFFCLVPFGGLTIAESAPERGLRWRQFAVFAAGPAVSLLAIVAIAASLPRGGLSDGSMTLAELLLWANALLLAQNLYPRTVRTSAGAQDSDGLALWKILFRWGEPPTDPVAPSRFRTVRKWAVVLTTAVGAIVLGTVSVLLLRDGRPPPGGAPLLVIVMLLAVAAAWVAVQVALRPADASARPPVPFVTRALEELQRRSNWVASGEIPPEFRKGIDRAHFPEAIARLEGLLQRYPLDPMLLLMKGELEVLAHRFADAEATYGRLLASLPPSLSASRGLAEVATVRCALGQGDAGRAEKLFERLLESDRATREKVEMLDAIVSGMLFEDPPADLQVLERWIRKVLALSPATVTLDGTLGGILAEQGRFDEAEPLLCACRNQSDSLHDKGISTFYLAIVAKGRGDCASARTLFERAMTLHADSWLVEKARRHLRELDDLPSTH